jgi:hypothetical protein
MSTDGLEHIGVVCTDCELSETADETTELVNFKQKHTEHTGHRTRWAVMPEDEKTPTTITQNSTYSLACETCDEEWEFNTQDDAVDYETEHATYTDHEPDALTSTITYMGTCLVCAEQHQFTDKEAAQHWTGNHDHERDIIPLEEIETEENPTHQVEAVEFDGETRTRSLKNLLSDFDTSIEDGAPMPLVVLEATRHGLHPDTVETELNKLQQTGEIYEIDGFIHAP